MAPLYYMIMCSNAGLPHLYRRTAFPAVGMAFRPSANQPERPDGTHGTKWDKMGHNGAGIAIFGQFEQISDTTEPDFGTKWDKMGIWWDNFPTRTPHSPPRARRSWIAVLDSLCSHGNSLAKRDSPGASPRAYRVLNAGAPISRHSRAGGNPNPHLPSHSEPKEELPLPLPSPPPFRPILCAA